MSNWVVPVANLYGTQDQLGFDMGRMVNSKYFYDCLLQVSEDLIYAHRAVLTSRSEWFKTALNENWSESNSVTSVEIHKILKSC